MIHFVRQGGSQLPHGGHAVDPCEIRLRLAQRLFCPLALGYVDHSTDEFNEIAGLAWNGMAYHVDVSDPAAGMNDSVIQLELRVLTRCCLDRFANFGLIIRMDALKERFVSRLSTVRIKTHHPVAFFGEVLDLALRRYRCPTARVAEPLRFRQITLASAQRFFRGFAVTALCLQSLVGILELSNCYFEVIARAPKRLRGAPLCNAQGPNK